MVKGALVLEGGSLRCLYTGGVLDVFLEHGLEFSYVSGVSAGSMCAMNYLSRQVGRTHDINLNYVHDKRYMSLRNMVKNREVFNFEFLFGELSHKLNPFDWETFRNTDQIFEAVATRCKTGKPEYFDCTQPVEDDFVETAVSASSSMPILSHMVDVRGKKYLDGGLSMPIPYQRAMDLGYEKVVLVLTRDRDYRKKEPSRLTEKAYDRYFAPLPELREAIRQIPSRYNRMKEEIALLEAEGKIFVIRPKDPVTVGRLEHNREKLEELYQTGRKEAIEQLPKLKEYLGI